MTPEDWAAQPKTSMPIERSVSFLKVPGAEEYPVGPLVAFLVMIMALDGADGALFPQLGKGLERTIGFDVGIIANLATFQAFVQAIFGPIWGVMCARGYMERKTILATMTFAQGLLTFFMSYSLEYTWLIVGLRGLNGACLAGLMPVANSIVADRFDDEVRGRFFALMNMSRGFGGTLSGALYVLVAEWCPASGRFGECGQQQDCEGGVAPDCGCTGYFGWQYCFIVVGAVTMALAPVIYTVMKPPPVAVKNVVAEGENVVVAELKALGKLVVETPTFLILVVQGCFGGLPWTALNFRTFYFQTAGLSADQTSFIGLVIGFVGIFGGGLSGWLSDCLVKITPLHGRIINAEISVYGGIPFAYFTFNLAFAPEVEGGDTTALFYYFLTLSVLMHLICGGVGGGTNAPILSQLAKPQDRALIIAWCASLEGCITAFGPAIFAVLNDYFGYDPDCNPGCNRPDKCGPEEDNTEAAGTALIFVSSVPWVVCGLMYSSLHYFYPRDMERIFEERRLENEAAGATLSTELVNS